ncbi:hypothetical protein PHMEG_00014552 [Phytophthora megakarya]|uniref:Ankyrin repeat protein n=1 Tax=Phytophthora megakarya TaxID=4795 RepID=A0A225W422_9STRA|nr:hypothetical protein PHMEG_00014552 [Phytophthora megakarya]
MAALDKALATAHTQLMQAHEELALPPAKSFQDAFLEVLRRPYETATRSKDTAKWRRSELRDFLSFYFPQYSQQPAAFSALWASLARKVAEREGDRAWASLARKVAEREGDRGTSEEVVDVTFDHLKDVLVRQYGSTRLVAKDPFPLEACVELKPDRRRSIAPFVPGSTSGADSASDEVTSMSVLREFQTEVLKKSKSWLGRWRARHLLLRWGVLEMHKRSLTSRSFRHHSSNTSSSASTSAINNRSDVSSSASSSANTSAGAAGVNIKTYDLHGLVSLKLEHVSDGETVSVGKAALTLKFQTTLAPSSNSHCTPNATSSQDIKALIIGGGETSETLGSIRDHIATFALYLELSRRDSLPSMIKVRRYIAAGAMVNMRVRIPRVSSKDARDGSRKRGHVKKPPRGMVTALQLAFLQDPRVPSFESTIALLLNAGADPRSLLYWDYATQVVFSPPSASSDKKEKSEEHQQRRRLRKRFLLLDKVESDGDENAVFSCCEAQADDGARWNLLMYFCWLGDIDSVKQLLNVTGISSTMGSKGRTSNRQLMTCLDHVNAVGDTALHIAIKSGKEPVALQLVGAALSTNAQAVHQCDARGEPVVHLALVAHQWRVADALVAAGAVDPRSYDALGNTALHLAIQLRAPVALISRLIQVYRHSAPSGGLDGIAGRRGIHDTPLSLALKSRQQEVVALLLASGASPSGSDCQWSQAFSEKREARNEEVVEEKGVIGDEDSALHVAIKAGLELAAAALIAHKADIYAIDSRGASPLALAVRYGLYALAATLVDQHQKRNNHAANKYWWVDGETGRPVVMLAFQAGQLELAALLLDCISQDKDSQCYLYPARLLPLLVQISSWLRITTSSSPRANGNVSVLSSKSSVSKRNAGGSVDGGDRNFDNRKKYRSYFARDRPKSRSDGEWRKLKNGTPHHGSAATSVSPSSENRATNKEDRDVHVFLLRGIQALVVRFLHVSDTSSVTEVIGGSIKLTPASLSTLPLVVHLPTTVTPTKSTPPRVFKDDGLITGSSLHVAASGGSSTSNLLRLLLAFLLKADASVAVKLLGHPIGSRSDTSLHAALEAGAAENALLLLYSSRDLRVRSPLVSPVCAQQLEMINLLGDSALHLACAWPHSTAMLLVVELLLQEHVDAGNWNNAGLAPLHVALCEGCDDTLIELFVRYGQDLNLWTEGNTYEGEGDDDSSEFLASSDVRPSAMTLVASCPQNPLMLALESENSEAFRALLRGGARTRALMPRARVGLLQLAVHFNVRDAELLACLLNDPELEHSAQSDVTDQWGISPRDARSKLMEIWRKERSGVDVHAARQAARLDRELKMPTSLRISVSQTSTDSVPLETAQFLRALPRPPTLSSTTLDYLREEERVTLMLVAQEARSEAQDWLAKRIGQKKILSDAHAQLQNTKKHRRSASGSSVSSSRDELEASNSEANESRHNSVQSNQHVLKELKVAVAKKFIDKHVADSVAEARLCIEREKQTIFQETGLYPGMTSASKRHTKKADGKHRSLLIRAASSTSGSILLPALSASVTSASSEEDCSTQLSDDSYGSASFWWSDRSGTCTFLSDDASLSWLSSSNSRGGTMFSDPGSVSVSSWASNGRGTMLDGDRRLSFASRSFMEGDENERYGKPPHEGTLSQTMSARERAEVFHSI